MMNNGGGHACPSILIFHLWN